MNYRKIFSRITLIVWTTNAVIFFMCFISLHMAEAMSLFEPAVNYDAGEVPDSVAIGDLNGDGDLDLAVANFGNDNVSVLLGNGDGSFQSPMNYGAGDEPRSVAIGDFNGDDHLDLAVANGASDNVSVLLGNGDGSFQNPMNYGAGQGAYSVAIGDLNGDDHLDLAVASERTDYVWVLLGNGDGSFQSAVNYGTDERAQSVAIGDLNGDDHLDLAVVNYGSDNVSVLLGNGDGSFQSAVNYGTGDGWNGSWSVAIGDFNGDDHLDLAVANGASDNVSVLLGNGDGSFQSAVNYGTGFAPYSDINNVATDDLNGDDHLDLAVVSLRSDYVAVLLGNGDGSFQSAVNYGTDWGPSSVAIGDLNGDDHLDLAVTIGSWNSNNVTILINRGELQIINDFVTFGPNPSTYSFTADTTGCPIGFAGKFNFDATLSNDSYKWFTNIGVECAELTNDNLLLTNHDLMGEGELFPITKTDDYEDGIFSAEEYIDVPFTVCLKNTKPFRFFVNVLGVAAD